jgi:hypothetical protein
MKKIILVAAMIIVATFYNELFAQKPAVVATNEPGWHHIGHTTASFKMQNESISVLGADEFSALKIKVTEAALQLERMQVFYESGDMEEVDLREHFGSGSESRTIVLKHPDKDIQKVAFTYKTAPNTGGDKADIDLYGLKTNQPAGADTYRDEKLEQKADEAQRELDQAKEDARVEADDDGDRDVIDAVEEGAKDAAAAITDHKLKDKVGPGGETAYVDEHGTYYIINNLGEKVIITKAQLRNKPKDKD